MGEFAATTTWADVPDDVRRSAARHVTDTVGVMIAGARSEVSRPVLDVLGAATGTGRVLATGNHLVEPIAALINGTHGHADDFDDDDPLMMVGHPSAPVVAAIGAMSDDLRPTGRRFLTAYVVGVEVEMRLGAGMNPIHYDRGWHATSTLGVVGAAAAAANLLGSDGPTAATAVGIATSLAGGLKANFGSMTKPVHAGWAAHGGVIAARFAAAGVDASPTALEHPLGFVDVLGRRSREDVSAELGKLGREWAISRPGLALKLYPSCSNTHPALDAVRGLREEHRLTADDVVSVECSVSPGTEEILIHPAPTTPLEAKFSMQYCLAAALTTGTLGLDDFTTEALGRPDVRALASRVSLVLDPSIARGDYGVSTAAEVAIQLSDGRTLRRTADAPRGSSGHPVDDARIAEKFVDCCTASLSPQAARDCFAALMDLGEAESVPAVFDMILEELTRGG